MTLFDFIKQCLRREAVRTEPDCKEMLQEILRAAKKEREKKCRPP